MSFHQPIWLLMLIPLPLLALLRVWSQMSSGKGGEALVSSRLRGELIVGASQSLRWAIFAVNLLALACLILALARPRWGFHEAEAISEGRNLLIAIDTSRSMLANDLTPDRMTRAKLAAQDMVAALPEDRIGLIAFAGKAFLQAPLTVDHDAILESIDQLDTEIIPRGGTNLYAPVQLALDTFAEAESKDSGLIIFSDGEDLEGGSAMADLKDKAGELGMTIIAIGVGTEEGSIIPQVNGEGQFVRDESGNVVRSRLDPKAMQDLTAESGAGAYVNLGGASSITTLVKKSLESLSKTRLEDQTKRVPIERFMWPLSGAVLLWLVAFLLPASSRAFSAQRESTNGGAATPPPIPVRGRSITLWLVGLLTAFSLQTRAEDEISAGFEALQERDFETAVSFYEQEIREEKSDRKKRWLNAGLGTAAYHQGDYEEAQQAFGEVLAEAKSDREIAKAHFNLGNSLFRKGQIAIGLAENKQAANPEIPAQIPDGGVREEAKTQWESAIEHYQATLDHEPNNAKAKRNIAVTQEYLEYLNQLEEQEKQQEEEKEQEKEEEKDEPKEEEKEENKEEGDESQEGDEEKDDQQNNDPNEQENQEEEGQEDPNEQKDDQGKEQEDSESGKENEGENGEKEESEPQDSEKKEGEGEDQDSQQQNGKEQEPFKPENGESPPPEDRDREGELEANPNQPQQSQQMTPEQLRQAAAAQARNPETGYSPSEARKMLRALSDESLEVRPIFEPVRAEKFKDW